MLRCVNIDELGVLLGKVKALDFAHNLHLQVEDCGDNRVFHPIFKCAFDYPLVNQKLQLIQDMLLDFFPQEAIGIALVFLNLRPLQFSNLKKLRRMGFDGIGVCGINIRRRPHHQRLIRDQFLNLTPISGHIAALDA